MTICQKISEIYKEMTETAADFRALDFRQGKSQKAKALELKKRLEISFQGFARRESEITDDTVVCFCRISREKIGAWKKIPRNLMCINGNTDFCNLQITDFGQLQSIGGHAFFRDSQITDLGQLQSIGKGAYFAYSQVIDLGKLQSIGGDVHFEGSKVINLGALKDVSGKIYVDKNSTLDFTGIKHGGIVYV